MTPPAPDPTVLEAALHGDDGAWRTLTATWMPVVWRWCRRLGGPDVDPSDAAQDVFVVVFTRLDRLHDLRRFEPWLFGITRRVLANHRRRARLRAWAARVGLGSAPLPEPDQRLALSDTARRVQALLERLPPRHREVLVLCDLEGRTTFEAAALLGIPPGTVRSRQRLARERLSRMAAP